MIAAGIFIDPSAAGDKVFRKLHPDHWRNRKSESVALGNGIAVRLPGGRRFIVGALSREPGHGGWFVPPIWL